jgi:putative transposase
MPLVNLVGQLKAYSSKWIKTKDESPKNFYWQDGYGAFSVNQKKTFQDEYPHVFKEIQC